MSLFEHHKLLFAFFVCLKVFEKDQSFQEGLMRLQKKSDKKNDRSNVDQSRLDNSSKLSDNKSSSHPDKQSQVQSMSRISMPRKSNHGRGVLSRHNESDNLTALNEETEQKMRDEEKKLEVDESLLKYLLTGLMMAEAEPYAMIENSRPDLFSETMWNELH